MVSISNELFALVKEGQFQNALLLSENNYQSEEKNIISLIDYVKILMEFKLFKKAENILAESGFDPGNNQNVFHLYRDLYIRWPNLKKLKELEKKYFPDLDDNYSVYDLTKNDNLVRPDQKYFKNQLLDLLKSHIEEHPQYKSVFKKAYLRVNNDRMEEGFYLLKEFAVNCNDKELGFFILAEMKLVEKDFKLAKKRFKKLLDVFEPKWLVLNRLGDIELALGNEDKAEKYYLSAYKINPDDLDTNLDLIRTYVLKNDINKAKSHYNKILRKFGEEQVGFIRSSIKNKSRKISDLTIVNGLVVYEGGGGVLPIEIQSINEASQKLIPTGNLGFSILDSLHLSYNVVLSSNWYKKYSNNINSSIRVNIPESIMYKDGPSAGLAFFMGIMTELMSERIPEDIAFTGELTLSGSVLPVGGIKEKVTAAHICGMKLVYIPKDNFPDLIQVGNKIKSALKIKLVNHYSDVLKDIWKT
jgi:tetratricopeptide (TPR) repeat protein